MFRQVSVIGLGYIGLPTAAMFASRNLSVVGIDINSHAVETINSGRIHIFEPDLEDLVQTAVASGKLRAATTAEPADAFIVAVPTPIMADKRPDLTAVFSVARTIAPVLVKGNLVILESTSPIGTTEQFAQIIADMRPDLKIGRTPGEWSDIHFAYCPERVLPGNVIRELVENDRVIGGMTSAATELCIELYKTFVRGDCVPAQVRAAELCKLAENAFRDVNIAYANELANVSDEHEIDVWEVIELANRHPRVNILKPGPGVGGHCIAVDPWFIVNASPEHTPLISAARRVNDERPDVIAERVHAAVRDQKVSRPSAQARIACFGLSFKADIDDIRESPAVEVVKLLASRDLGQLFVVEPFLDDLPMFMKQLGVQKIEAQDALRDADIFVLLVDHKAFCDDIALEDLRGRPIIDSRGIWRDKR